MYFGTQLSVTSFEDLWCIGLYRSVILTIVIIKESKIRKFDASFQRNQGIRNLKTSDNPVEDYSFVYLVKELYE